MRREKEREGEIEREVAREREGAGDAASIYTAWKMLEERIVPASKGEKGLRSE